MARSEFYFDVKIMVKAYLDLVTKILFISIHKFKSLLP